jgi:molybdenum cofactor cytidylyltransferase
LELLVVLGPGDELLAQQLRHQGINTVIAANAAAGMGCSLAAAAAVVDEASAMLVVLADMPYVLSTTLRGIADRLGSGAAIVRPVYRGRGGNPVGFAPCFREQLMDLAGTVGARELLRIHAAEILHWQVDDPGIIHDIDYPADITWV